jgi:hypothetical protein
MPKCYFQPAQACPFRPSLSLVMLLPITSTNTNLGKRQPKYIMRLFTATLILVVSAFATASIALPPNAIVDKIQQAPRPNIRREEGDGSSGSASLRRPDTGFWDDDYATDADWDKYIHKGGALMCALVGSDQTAGRQIKDTRNPPSAASIWSGDLKQELRNWYWREMTPSSKGCQLAGWEFGAMLRSLGLSEEEKSDDGDNQCFRIEHWDVGKEDDKGKQVPAINQWYKVGGTDYRVSARRETMTHADGRLTSW